MKTKISIPSLKIEKVFCLFFLSIGTWKLEHTYILSYPTYTSVKRKTNLICVSIYIFHCELMSYVTLFFSVAFFSSTFCWAMNFNKMRNHEYFFVINLLSFSWSFLFFRVCFKFISVTEKKNCTLELPLRRGTGKK